MLKKIGQCFKSSTSETLTSEGHTRVYPKVSGLSQLQNKQQQTLIEKHHKGLWWQNLLD